MYIRYDLSLITLQLFREQIFITLNNSFVNIFVYLVPKQIVLTK